MTITRSEELYINDSVLKQAGENLLNDNALGDFTGDDIVRTVLGEIFDYDFDKVNNWVDAMTFEQKKELIDTVKTYYIEAVLTTVEESWKYIEEHNYN